MPIFTPGANAPDCGGSRESAVFQTTANGRIFRARVKPIRKRSAVITKSRSNLLAVASSWRTLTSIEQQEWDDVAATFPQIDTCGNEYYLSGQQLFIKGNQSRAAAGQTLELIAPASISISVPALSFVQINPFFNNIVPVGTPFTVPTGELYKFYVSEALPGGISTIAPSDYKLLRSSPAGQSFSQNLFAPWVTEHGPLLGKSGLYLFTKIIPQQASSGIQGTPTYSKDRIS